LSAVGAMYLLVNILDFFSIYRKDQYSQFAIIPIFAASIIYVLISRRPVTKVKYKIPNKDYILEVKIGELLSQQADVVISTSTTFDTNMMNGLISVASLQGQFATRFFGGQTTEIDRQLTEQLQDVPFTPKVDAPGKDRDYPIGTVATVRVGDRNFYFLAMSRLNEQGNARATVREVEDALDSLWGYIKNKGELRTIAIPVVGTGRGRIDLPRKKVIERIAQSFADASRDTILSNQLTIVVSPQDAEAFSVNLFEVRDYLARSLHT
jgi:hypothetical protein